MPHMRCDLSGKVAVVTGGARGLGYAIAEALRQAGATVGVLSSSRESVAQAAARLGGFALHADVRREDQVQAAFAEVARRCGRLDVLVNNAGIAGPTAPLAETTLEQWNETLEVNITGAFLCAREAVRLMLPHQSGRIINISSLGGLIGYALRTPYACSKWAMIGLTKSLAMELGPYNIQVNAICPGPVEGERIERVIATRAESTGLPVEAVRRKYAGMSALGRFVRPQDVADLVVYLASDSGLNLTAQAYEVAAGYGASV
jgi:NAD(P)-dependent dehydrogenase (short-subunit alcohol dehydrogenase family)